MRSAIGKGDAVVLAAVTALALARCDVAGVGGTDGPDVADEPQVDIIAPARIVAGEAVPVVVEARTGPEGGDVDTHVTGLFELDAGAAVLSERRVSLKKGRGSLTTQVQASADFEFTAAGTRGTRRVDVAAALPEERYGGVLAGGAHLWDASRDRVVAEDLTVPEGAVLTIAEGTRVRLGPEANLLVQGALVVAGSHAAPVLFTAADPAAPWGGVVVHGRAEVAYAFFAAGGADATRTFGHSNSQPVLMVDGGAAVLDRTFFLDNPGKALGAHRGTLDFRDGLISRCDTGGEFGRSLVHITGTHVLDIPNADGVFVDDDNDGLYFWHPHASGAPSVVAHTYIITGKDDAVDHNGADLEIRHSWLEDFMHEGVAGSSGSRVLVYDTVVRGCQQGIEAGYGSPHVVVDHSVVVDNEVGLRFGDSYASGNHGRMDVTDTIVFGNDDNVWNYDRSIEAARDSGIVISYSMPNDPEYDGCPGCLTGTPRFDEDYYLLPASPGAGAAEDGSDMGRTRTP